MLIHVVWLPRSALNPNACVLRVDSRHGGVGQLLGGVMVDFGMVVLLG